MAIRAGSSTLLDSKPLSTYSDAMRYELRSTSWLRKALSFTVVLLLPLLFPAMSYANGDFFDVFYDASAIVRVTVNPELHRPTTLRLRGPVVIRSSQTGDKDDDSKPDIQTEMLSMNLTGTTSQGLAVNLNSSKSNRSLGMAEQLLIPLGRGAANLRANSFFDVFTEVSVGSPPGETSLAAAFFDVFVTDQSFHLEAITRNLTDLSGLYANRKNITVTLFREGTPSGTLTLLAVNLNSSKSN